MAKFVIAFAGIRLEQADKQIVSKYVRHYYVIIVTFLGRLYRGVNEISGSLKDENFVSSRMAVACVAGLPFGSLTM
jgi:hypothetical protein